MKYALIAAQLAAIHAFSVPAVAPSMKPAIAAVRAPAPIGQLVATCVPPLY
jgi:hypothetical protein